MKFIGKGGFHPTAGSSGPAQYGKVFSFRLLDVQLESPREGSFVISVSPPGPSILLALSKSVNNVCLYS